MFSKKSLQITLAFVLLVALASIGLAYGAWTENLNVNGTVGTGTFDVVFQPYWTEYYVEGCDAAVSTNGHTLTVTITNAYPGFHCGGGVTIENKSSIAAKINGLVAGANNVPATFQGGAGLVFMTDAVGNKIPTGGSYTLAAKTYGGGVMWDFTIPATETGHEGENYTFSYTILAEQAQ
jgi:hypothetical protein